MNNIVTINWYALPHCPEKQLQKGKFPTDTGYDIRSAETIEVPTYQSLRENNEFSYEEVGTLENLAIDESLVTSNPSLMLDEGVVYRIKYKIPLIKTGIVVRSDDLAWTAVVARSGTPKLGVVLANSIGIIDYEYSKVRSDVDADEICVQLIALHEPTVIFRGERIAQLIPQHYVKNQLNPTQDQSLFSGAPRGGFNSSGSF